MYTRKARQITGGCGLLDPPRTGLSQLWIPCSWVWRPQRRAWRGRVPQFDFAESNIDLIINQRGAENGQPRKELAFVNWLAATSSRSRGLSTRRLPSCLQNRAHMATVFGRPHDSFALGFVSSIHDNSLPLSPSSSIHFPLLCFYYYNGVNPSQPLQGSRTQTHHRLWAQARIRNRSLRIESNPEKKRETFDGERRSVLGDSSGTRLLAGWLAGSRKDPAETPANLS